MRRKLVRSRPSAVIQPGPVAIGILLLCLGGSVNFVRPLEAQVIQPVPQLPRKADSAEQEFRSIPLASQERLLPGDPVEILWSNEIRRGQVIHFDKDQGYFIEVHHFPGGGQRRTFRPRDQVRLVHPGRRIQAGDEVDFEIDRDVRRGIVQAISQQHIRVVPAGQSTDLRLPRFEVAGVHPVSREPLRRWELLGTAGRSQVVIGKVTSVSSYAAMLEGRDQTTLLVPLVNFSIPHRRFVQALLDQAERDDRKRYSDWGNDRAEDPPHNAAGMQAADGVRPSGASRPRIPVQRNPAGAGPSAGRTDPAAVLQQIRNSGDNVTEMVAALVSLARVEIPESLREQAFAVVGPLLEHERNTVHANAFRVLQQLEFTSTELDWLLRAYTVMPRQAAEAMARIEDPAVVAFLAERAAGATRITDPVFAAVETVGASAESALWPLLKHPHVGMSARARAVLEKIGTSRTVDFVLERQLTTDPRIQQMVERIEGREQ